MYIDFHTHSLRNIDNKDVLEIISVHPNQQKYKQYFTLGYHPWWTQDLLTQEELLILENTYSNDIHCLALGEFGLDKLQGPAIDRQMEIVKQQLSLAERLQAPVIIHCVRQYDALTKLKLQYNIPAWVIHGYYRNKELAMQLIDKGFYLSFCCHQNAPSSFLEAVKVIPIDKMFLETDSYPTVNIIEVYEFSAQIKNIGLENLKNQILQNIKMVFSKCHIG
jgi:TatD DNase family protein